MDYFKLLCGTAFAVAVTAAGYVVWGPNVVHKAGTRDRVTGLVNLGKSCFLNAILQALASCTSFVSWIERSRSMVLSITDNCDNLDLPLLRSMENILNVLRGQQCIKTDNSLPANPLNVLKALEHHRWVVSRDEQDAHEMFHALMETLNEEVEQIFQCKFNMDLSNEDDSSNWVRGLYSRFSLKLPSLQKNAMAFPFSGRLSNQRICRDCGQKSTVGFDSYDSISLSIPYMLKIGRQKVITLEDCLRYFVRQETIFDVICSGCNKLNKSTSSVLKQVFFAKLPPVLCFHIQRMVWMDNGMPNKRHDFISFPETLNMYDFTYKHAKSTSVGRHSLCCGFKDLHRMINKDDLFPLPASTSSTNATQSFGSSSNFIGNDCNYQLQAVVVHVGDVHSGHFVTYRRKVTETAGMLSIKWYLCSDTAVKEVSLNTVLKSCAYMLFYERSQSLL